MLIPETKLTCIDFKYTVSFYTVDHMHYPALWRAQEDNLE